MKACVLVALTFAHRSEGIHVTLAAFPDTYPKLDQEMRRQEHVAKDVLARLQWLEVKPNAEKGLEGLEGLMKGYEAMFERLMLPSNTNLRNTFDIPPNLIIYDVSTSTYLVRLLSDMQLDCRRDDPDAENHSTHSERAQRSIRSMLLPGSCPHQRLPPVRILLNPLEAAC